MCLKGLVNTALCLKGLVNTALCLKGLVNTALCLTGLVNTAVEVGQVMYSSPAVLRPFSELTRDISCLAAGLADPESEKEEGGVCVFVCVCVCVSVCV